MCRPNETVLAALPYGPHSSLLEFLKGEPKVLRVSPFPRMVFLNYVISPSMFAEALSERTLMPSVPLVLSCKILPFSFMLFRRDVLSVYSFI